jgi:hypothetical protein
MTRRQTQTMGFAGCAGHGGYSNTIPMNYDFRIYLYRWWNAAVFEIGLCIYPPPI